MTSRMRISQIVIGALFLGTNQFSIADETGVGRGNSGPDSQPTEPAQTESATEGFLQSLEVWFDLDTLTEE